MINILKNKNEFDSTNLILFFWKWHKALIIIVLIAAIVSSLASYLITPKYKATVVIFPTMYNSISKSLIAITNGNEKDIMEFGDEERSEQLLQILSSAEVRNRVVRNFDLLKYWKINKEDKKWLSYMIYEYSEMVTFRRTEFMAVEIKVMAKDAKLAAEIANEIPLILDSVKTEMQQQRAKAALKLVEIEINKVNQELTFLVDSMQKINRLGINDYLSQSERYNQQMAIAIAQGNQRAIDALQKKLDILSEYGSAYINVFDLLTYKRSQLSNLNRKYDEAKMDSESIIPQKFVVEKALQNNKKAYPVRWLIVSVSTISVFILSIVVLLIFETISQVTRTQNNENK